MRLRRHDGAMGGYGSGVGRVRICIAIFVEYPNKGYAEYYKAMRLRY